MTYIIGLTPKSCRAHDFVIVNDRREGKGRARAPLYDRTNRRRRRRSDPERAVLAEPTESRISSPRNKGR